jgi:selenide,water dikinase
MLEYDVHAATDVTGFGLAGHAVKMAEGSAVTFEIEESDLPLLPGALELAREGMIPGGGKRNRDYYGKWVRINEEIADQMIEIVFDPQTSGGLLIALSEPGASNLVRQLHQGGNMEASIIGRVRPRGEFAIEVV